MDCPWLPCAELCPPSPPHPELAGSVLKIYKGLLPRNLLCKNQLQDISLVLFLVGRFPVTLLYKWNFDVIVKITLI